MKNYIGIVNLFWESAPYLDGFKADHAALFFAIIDSINRNDWNETEIEYDRLINKIRIGKKNYLDCRKWLVDMNFITLRPGRGDYSKAAFGVGSMVPDAVSNAVLPNTAPNALQSSDAVPSDTAPGPQANRIRTAGEPHPTPILNKTYKPINLKTNKPLNNVVDTHESTGKGFSKKSPSPYPLPVPVDENEVRQELLTSAPHIRYAIEQMKVAADEREYGELLENFILQQQAKAGNDQVFKSMKDARSHFLNWLKYQRPNTPNSHGNNNTRNQTKPRNSEPDLNRAAAFALTYAGLVQPTGAGTD